MSFVRLLGDVEGITSIKTHLKVDFGFRGTFDLAFLLIEEILQEVQKGSASMCSSASSHTFAVSTRSLMAGDTANVWEDAELQIDAHLNVRLKLWADTTSPRNKKDQYACKCLMTTERLLLRRYITSYWHQTCATDYFPSLH